MSKSVEQRLFEAYVSGRGIKLTTRELDQLILPDDAIQARIENAAVDESGCDCTTGRSMLSTSATTWRQYQRELTQ